MRQRPEFRFDDFLGNSAERDPDHIAVIDGANEYSYAELVRATDALSTALIEADVAKGDRVGIYMEKSWEAIVGCLATSQIGAAFVNVNPGLKPAQVKYIAEDAALRVMLGDADKLDALDPGTVEMAFYKGSRPPTRTASEREPRDLAEVLAGKGDGRRRTALETDLSTILYTSGSTGMPKGVAFSQRNLVVGAQIVTTYLENSGEDRILSVLPFSFDYGLNQLVCALRVGATLIVQHSRLPGDLLKGLRRHRATGVAGVPPVWQLLLRNAKSLEAEPLDSLRYITNSGGRIPQANLDEMRRLLPHTRIFLMYGLTEAFRSTYLPPEEIDRGSECIGKAIPNTEILVIKDGREVEVGEIGELVHRGPTVAMGYWGKEEETRRAYRPNPLAPTELFDLERVVYSGDLVRKDDEGYFYFVGRNDAMIKSMGYRMSPDEVENLLIASGLVREACAFGVPDPDLGHILKVALSLKDGVPETAVESIREYAMKNGPSYMTPREIIVLDELPHGGTGKIDRRAIGDTYGAAH